jgi:hypothetical protein
MKGQIRIPLEDKDIGADAEYNHIIG